MWGKGVPSTPEFALYTRIRWESRTRRKLEFMVGQLMILRHGFSTWNEKNLFTGWVDVALSPIGVDEAKRAGRVIAESKFEEQGHGNPSKAADYRVRAVSQLQIVFYCQAVEQEQPTRRSRYKSFWLS